MRVRRSHILLVLVLCLGMLHCDQFSCGSDDEDPADTSQKEHWIRSADAVGLAPQTARTVVVSDSIESLLQGGELVARSLPVTSPRVMSDAWEGQFGWKVWKAKGWRVWGVDAEAPAVLFYDRGWWAVAMTVDDPERFMRVRQDWIDDESISAQAAETGEFEGVNLQLGPRRVHIASNQKVLVAALKVHESPSDAASGEGFPSAWLPSESSFVDRLGYHDLLIDALEFGQPAGIVRPAAWMTGTDSTGQAKVLYERIAAQLGPVAFAMQPEEGGSGVHIRVLTPGEKGAPRAVTDLGEASGELPPVGGLIEPGVLGVARVSASPEALYQLFMSGLSAERRTQFNDFWRRLDEELRIDARANVLQNLRGHAIVAMYGIKTEVLAEAGEDWINSVTRLDATREAVLLTIEDRTKMRRVLDALTTVTKNKLRRQAVGETIQYAFFSDGQLEWAFILGDNHVLYVDSAVAFDQAMAYEEEAHPLGESMAETGLSNLIDPAQVSGFYLDAENLGNLLTEAQNPSGAQLLEPFRRVLLTTTVEDGVGITDVHLQLAPPRPPPGERAPQASDEDASDVEAPDEDSSSTDAGR